MIHYPIELTEAEVEELLAIVSKGAHSTRAFRNACILLNCDEGRHAERLTQQQLARMLTISQRTVERVKKRFCEEGLQAVLERKPSCRIYERKLDGDAEAHLVQLCCSEPPQGRVRWSLRLLADKMVELHYVPSVSHVTVRDVLKKTNCGPGRSPSGSSPLRKAAPL